jgi:hypothetical protein
MPAATEAVASSAGVGMRWMALPGSARVAGMAGAFVAQGAELGALEINPAGLAGLDKWEVAFTHNAWIEGMSVDRVAGGAHLGTLGTVGASFDYLNLGQIESITLDASGNPINGDNLFPNAMALGLNWAGAYGALGLGLGLKVLQQDLTGGSISHGFQGDLGGRWIFANGLRLGASAQNLGFDDGGGQRPLRFRTGLGYTLLGAKPLALELNADIQPNDQSGAVWRAGTEWAVFPSLALRAGYVLGNPDQASGFTAGFGWMAGILDLDYAAYAVGDLGMSHLLSLQLVP